MFKIIEAVGRCVVLFDEIEKSLAGSQPGAAADGGVASDALGALLSWMSDRTCEGFIIATSNNADALPPELLRKGRFDEIFFVDLPSLPERGEVLRAAITANGRDAGALEIDVSSLERATDGFTGSEIAAIVPDAMFAAFADGEREFDTDDLIAAAETVVPLSKTAAEKMAKLRYWANGRARPASTPFIDARKETASVRKLNLA